MAQQTSSTKFLVMTLVAMLFFLGRGGHVGRQRCFHSGPSTGTGSKPSIL